MAFTRTVVVVAAFAAVLAQLSAAGCPCGCANGGDSYANSGDSYAEESGSARSSWTTIPRGAVVTNIEQVTDNCDYNPIHVPDEPAPAVGIIQSRPVCAQHLSYGIEVPVEDARPVVPSYHSVSVEVPIRQRTRQVLTHLPYSVEVPVEQQECQKLAPMSVDIAVPVRQRVAETRMHSTYSVEVPAEQGLPSRLCNLKAHVDRVVLPPRETCLPPNNGPAPVDQVTYVAVPAPAPVCVSPVGLLGLRSSSASSGSNYGASSGSSYGSSYGSGSGSGSGRSSGCRCPCDD